MNTNMLKEIFQLFRENKVENEITLDDMKVNLERFKDKIVLYGAGSAGIAFYQYLRSIGIKPVYFSDGNPKRIGQFCEGVKIISPEQIIPLVGNEVLVIVTINTNGKIYCKSFDETLRKEGHEGVHKNLKEYGCNNVIDYTYFRKCYSLFCGDLYNLPSCSDVYLMEKSESEIKTVYDFLADTISKRVYSDIVKFRLIDDTIEIPTLSQETQYFEYEIYNKSDKEVFIDCGAYNGITLKKFLLMNNDFLKYYAFEPDENNYISLSEYVKTLNSSIQNKINTYNNAVCKDNGVSNLYALGGPGSFVNTSGKLQVNTVTIDSIIKDYDISYIKMNIEGSELDALYGAQNTIVNNKPVLAIAGYHKTWDLWQIPLLIKKLNPDYKIYLRSYMNHISFVYYAVPDSR